MQNIVSVIDVFSKQQNTQDSIVLRLAIALVAAILASLVINRFITFVINNVATIAARRSSSGLTPSERLIHTKRAETLMSIGGAVSRVIVLGICLYISWRIANPTTAPVAVIGAGTFFALLGAATIGPLLRDLTSGILMITEKWYNVGDHIVVDPFKDLSGIVEKVNLRSTKLRSLSGEVIWVHNQNIQAVRVTPHGVKTISIDTFVRDLDKGRRLIGRVINTMPTGPTMIATPLVIKEEEQHGGLWRITAVGQTAPGREWLIEHFAVNAIKEADGESSKHIIVHGPIVRYTDAIAEKRFKHSMDV